MIGKDTGQGENTSRNLEIETVGEQSTKDTIDELPERGGRSSKSVIDVTSDVEEGRRVSFA